MKNIAWPGEAKLSMRSWEGYFSVCNRWHENNTRDTTKIVRHRNIRIIVVPVRHNRPINHEQQTIFTHRCRAGYVCHLLRLHSGDDVTIDCAVHYGPWNFDSNMWWNRHQIIATGHPWQLVAIGSGDGFFVLSQQAIIWFNADPVVWRHLASPVFIRVCIMNHCKRH